MTASTPIVVPVGSGAGNPPSAVRHRLHGVTLCAVESRPSRAILRALARSLEQIDCDQALLLAPHRPVGLPAGVRHIAIPAFASVAEYSRFMLTDFQEYFETEHVLLIQWDGFVLDGQLWQHEFLEFDYIGAPWPHLPEPANVGNGGFSLRSKRLLRALSDPDFVHGGPEDLAICVVNRELLEQRHGIRFATPELAAHFSREHTPILAPTFGFHGIFNFPEAFGTDLEQVLDSLEDLLLLNRDARTLCLRLLSADDADRRATGRRFLRRLLIKTPWSKHNWSAIRATLRRS